jgi:hypothetical protein
MVMPAQYAGHGKNVADSFAGAQLAFPNGRSPIATVRVNETNEGARTMNKIGQRQESSNLLARSGTE